MAFIYFGFELTWWRVFQKRVVRNKLDIYVLITVGYLFLFVYLDI